MIETRLLRQFIVVAEELHFHRAAERLHMAQPPLSQAIRKLEGEIGARLFERTNRSVALTVAGASFLETARRLIAQLDEGVEQARRMAAGIEGRLVVTFIDTAHYAALPPLLRAFRARYPGIELTLREATTAEQIMALESGKADIGFLRQPGSSRHRLTLEPVCREAILVALPDDHPRASARAVRLADLAAEAFVATPRLEGPGLHDQFIALCRLAGFSPRIVQEARQMQTVAGLVAGGLGVALVPASLAQARRDGVTFRPITVAAPKDMFHVALFIAWDASRASPARDTFLELARTTKCDTHDVSITHK